MPSKLKRILSGGANSSFGQIFLTLFFWFFLQFKVSLARAEIFFLRQVVARGLTA
jgi:hypothetical protein